MFSKVVVWLIRLYQKSFPLRYSVERNLHLPYHPCRFAPSCSEYTILSINKYGVIKGMGKGFSQILRCNGFVSR
ncbi:MAG: membrane protein insertion efficiency factor YidD [Patescibacteria group bacterium]